MVRQIMACSDRLSDIIGFNEAVLYLQPLYLEYMQKQDNWRYAFSALMTASQIGVIDAEVDKTRVFVQWALMAGEHQHPKIRYAAMHLIGQLA